MAKRRPLDELAARRRRIKRRLPRPEQPAERLARATATVLDGLPPGVLEALREHFGLPEQPEGQRPELEVPHRDEGADE